MTERLADPTSALRAAVKRIEVLSEAVRITLNRHQLDAARSELERQIERLSVRLGPGRDLEPGDGPDELLLTLPVRLQRWGGRTWLVKPKGGLVETRARVDPALATGLRRAHAILKDHHIAASSTPSQMREASSPVSAYQRKLCMLALISPEVQRLILEGR